MAEIYQSQFDGVTIDEQIKYVKDTVRRQIPEFKLQIQDKANEADVVKYTEKNKPNGYVGLDSDGKIPKDILGDTTDAYTKVETDLKLDKKANISDIYNTETIDTLLKDKADIANVYTKDEADTKLKEKINSSVVGELSDLTTANKASLVDAVNENRDAINDMLDGHGERLALLEDDRANFYTKTEVDSRIGDIDTALDNIIALQNAKIGGDV